MFVYVGLGNSKSLLFKFSKLFTSREIADNPNYACNRFCILKDSLSS